ncbi:MAG: CPBP family intramembrane glutamic endopeptidase [Myxococcota bacterium]
MKIAGKIVAYTLGVVIVAALLAPVLWWIGQWGIESGTLSFLEGFRFAKYFNRAMLIVALVSLWPFLRWMGLKTWTELGLEPNPRRFKDLGIGIATGVVGLWVVAFGLLLTGQSVPRESIPWLKLAGAFGTATIVPLIEEPVFRGALFGLLRKGMSWKWALGSLSFFFAILHFARPPPGSMRITDVHWYSGFDHFTRVFWQFGRPELVVGGWLTLFVVGWILGYTVVRTRSLYLALGLHGGWVLALRTFYFVSSRRAAPSIWVGKDLTTGIVPLLLLLASFAVIHLILERRDQAHRRGEGQPS